MKYNQEAMYDFAEFDKILFESDIFENNISIGRNVDNANRKSMNKTHFESLTNANLKF